MISASAGFHYDALLQLLRTSETIWNASRIFFAQWDLSPSQFNILNLLRLNPGGMTSSELSRRLIMHRSNAKGLIDRLEQRRLVRRKPVVGNRRVRGVFLTPAGNNILRLVLPKYYKAAHGVWGDLSRSEVDRLVKMLSLLASNAKALTAARTLQSSR